MKALKYCPSPSPLGFTEILAKLGHLKTLYLSRASVVWPDKLFPAKHPEDKHLEYFYRQDKDLFMTKILHVTTRY